MRGIPLVCAVYLASAAGLQAQNPLNQMTDALQALVKKVSPAVVKVLVTGYGVDEGSQGEASLISRQHSLGSGVVVDPNGYIITNAHVVRGAQRVRVAFSQPPAVRALAPARPRILDAKIAGVDKDRDLAVLKVEATGLATLPIGDYQKLGQGQLVLAFGNPEGLENSVTMGLISSVMRQPDPDQPLIYIQTDAAINPGNSGGPLVDVDGNLVGINTFILSESGGSEGIGFAIPSVVVSFVYQEIRMHGHVHRLEIGANLQSITPALAHGLGLSRDWGVVVSDVLPGGPADTAGLKMQDIVVSVDGAPMEGLPTFEAALYRRSHGKPIAVEVLRGSQKLSLTVPVAEESANDYDDLASLVNPEKSLVAGLGILGVEINSKISDMLPELRVNSGVIVAARSAGSAVNLAAGDIIHALNATAITTLQGLREALKNLKEGDSAVLQVERDGKLMYLAFDLE